MTEATALLEFVRLPMFERHAKGLLREDDVREVEQVLIEDPGAGDVIAGTGGIRKLRFALAGQGKRGGVRVIYYHRRTEGRVYLITVYRKNAKDDLTDAERNTMKTLTNALDRET
jgi:hypothetical protein